MGISLYASTKIVSITSPTTSVTVQELVNTIRDWEDEQENLAYTHVIDAVGKADLGGSVTTGITMSLSSLWQIQFWNGVNRGTIRDGNIVGGVGGIPIKNTGSNDTILQLSAVATTIGDTSSFALESTAQEIKAKTDNLPASPAPANEYDTPMGYIPADLGSVPTAAEMIAAHGSGAWTTADVSALATAASLTIHDTKLDVVKAKTDTIEWGDITSLVDEIGGKWEISGNQMIFYKADNITEIFRFNLFDVSGNPAMTNVYKRERVP